MSKLLPILSIVFALLFFNFNTTVYASTTTTQKQFHAYWQLLTLKQVLTVQANNIATRSTGHSTLRTESSGSDSKSSGSSATTPTPGSTTPTPTKTPVPTPSISKPASVTVVSPTQAQPTQPQTASTANVNDVTTYIMSEINKYRASQGLGAVQTNDETCNFAKTRAQEITSSFTHDGFNSRVSSHTLPYAHWTSVTENIAMTSDYKQVETMWQNSPGHAENMRADTPYVCVIQSGNYFAYEGMKP